MPQVEAGQLVGVRVPDPEGARLPAEVVAGHPQQVGGGLLGGGGVGEDAADGVAGGAAALGGDAVADVADALDDAQAVAGLQGAEADLDGELAAVHKAAEGVGAGAGLLAAGQAVVAEHRVGGEVGGRLAEEAVGAEAGQFGGVVAEQLGGLGVGQEDLAVLVHDEQGVGGGLEQAAELDGGVLAAAQAAAEAGGAHQDDGQAGGGEAGVVEQRPGGRGGVAQQEGVEQQRQGEDGGGGGQAAEDEALQMGLIGWHGDLVG